jgi:hypothetical protein
MRLQALIFSLLCSLSTALCAAAPAVVDQVRAPAWVDRGERTLPLAPGFELKSGDVVRTGSGARAYLKLAEGSTVKLGESARFTLYSHSLHPERVFKGALDIATGAFRFTTDALHKVRAQRDVTIRVATATLGIRGTDVWGRADQERDLVALIEGRIDLVRAGQTLELVPMTYMDAPRGQPAEIRPLSLGLLRTLARQTEIEPDDGASKRQGKWGLVLGEYLSQQEALDGYDALRQAGFAVKVRPRAGADGGWQYVLQLPGFASQAEAAAAAVRIKTVTGIDAAPAPQR